MTMKSKLFSALTIPLMLALFAGCRQEDQSGVGANDEFFPAEGPNRPYQQFQTAQAAAGARHDAMLYDYHFNGPSVNSLGQQKLTLMAHAEDVPFPVVVYMVMPHDALAADRSESVRRFMKDVGLLDSQVEIRYGPNPDASNPAGPAIDALTKQNGGDSGAPAGPTGGGSYPAAPTAGDAPK